MNQDDEEVVTRSTLRVVTASQRNRIAMLIAFEGLKMLPFLLYRELHRPILVQCQLDLWSERGYTQFTLRAIAAHRLIMFNVQTPLHFRRNPRPGFEHPFNSCATHSTAHVHVRT